MKFLNCEVISPLLANLVLHYTLDVWLGILNPSIEFVCYADDITVHCSTQSQAEQNLQKIKERLEYCGLILHPDKTKIVYCKDFRRQQKYKKVKLDFLGYTFQPHTSKSKKTGKLFLGFDCAISIQSRTRILEQIRKMEIPRMRCDSIVGIAHHLNPKLGGRIRYFGKYRVYFTIGALVIRIKGFN